MNASGVKSSMFAKRNLVIWSDRVLVHYLSDAPFQLRACSCGVSSFFADGKVEVKSLTIALAFPNKHSLNQVSPSSGVQIAFAFSDTQKVFLHGTSCCFLLSQ